MNFRVKPFEFNAGFLRREAPVDGGGVRIGFCRKVRMETSRIITIVNYAAKA